MKQALRAVLRVGGKGRQRDKGNFPASSYSSLQEVEAALLLVF